MLPYKLEPSKKRYTDHEVYDLVRWAKGVGLDTSYCDIYMYYVSNIEIVRHIISLIDSRAKRTGSLLITPKQIKVTIYKQDDLLSVSRETL